MNQFKMVWMALVIASMMVILSSCTNTKTNSQTYSEETSDLEETKITTPVFKQSGWMLGSVTLWPDGSERTGRIKSPHEDAYGLAESALKFIPMALFGWMGFDYLKSDSRNDAATAQSRPPVVNPEIVRPEVIMVPEGE